MLPCGRVLSGLFKEGTLRGIDKIASKEEAKTNEEKNDQAGTESLFQWTYRLFRRDHAEAERLIGI